MTSAILNPRDMDFLLYEMLDTASLLNRPCYRQHSHDIFNVTLDTAQTLARDFFANHYQKGDHQEPEFNDGRVAHIPETKQAWKAIADAGFMAAHLTEEEGGSQLPGVICSAANAYFSAANIATSGYPFLTMGACNLIRSFGSEAQKALFVEPMSNGRFSGTMALTEPGQGSSLGDIKTTAELQPDGSYRLKGQKMFISNGDHELTENIIHLVLAKIKGAPAGVKGISLFIVPKVLVNADGSLGERNDVALAGLLHKMGFRNATSTVLNFGEKAGGEKPGGGKGSAHAYLVGEPHQGLGYMFQMMNEARIGVGMGAAVLAYQGYLHSLHYARQRPQGRKPSDRDPNSPQVLIIAHADVRRMLLAQKSYAEGALALCLYACSLAEDAKTAETESERQRAQALLDLLTPVVKSWPSRYGCVSNDLAIQVLGGSGYIRDYPVEQLYRDQRLNPIHEGTEGIQGLDLLGRKVLLNNGHPFGLFCQEVRISLQLASEVSVLDSHVTALRDALHRLEVVTRSLKESIRKNPEQGLANATVYLDMFGRVVVSWIWLKQALVASRALCRAKNNRSGADEDFYRGKLQAARYYFEWELPHTAVQADLLLQENDTCLAMQDAWFG